MATVTETVRAGARVERRGEPMGFSFESQLASKSPTQSLVSLPRRYRKMSDVGLSGRHEKKTDRKVLSEMPGASSDGKSPWAKKNILALGMDIDPQRLWRRTKKTDSCYRWRRNTGLLVSPDTSCPYGDHCLGGARM